MYRYLAKSHLETKSVPNFVTQCWFAALQVLVPLFVAISLSACAPSKGPKGDSGPKGSSGRSNNSLQMTGSTSGGGGYGSEPGNYVLERVREELVNELTLVNEEVFSDVPIANFKSKLIEIVSALKADNRTEKGILKPVVRDGEELYFDYFNNHDKKVIVATRLFYQSQADFEYSELPESKIVPKIRYFKVRALHEALHHFGIGTSKATDNRARKAAEDIIQAIETNNLICEKSTKDMPRTYFRFWQRYRVFDPIFRIHCLNQIEDKAEKFFSESGLKHTNGTRMDLQLSNEIIDQKMTWVINRPTGIGMFDPNLNLKDKNTPEHQINESRLTQIRAGAYPLVQNHDSDNRRDSEAFPYFRFRNPLSYFASYDFSFESNENYLNPSKYLDWQSIELVDNNSLTFSSADKASAFIVKSSNPVTYSENFICDTQVYYESHFGDLPVEAGERISRYDLKVSEQLHFLSGSPQASISFSYSISERQEFHLGPWVGGKELPPVSDEFDITCEESFSQLDINLFTQDSE